MIKSTKAKMKTKEKAKAKAKNEQDDSKTSDSTIDDAAVDRFLFFLKNIIN